MNRLNFDHTYVIAGVGGVGRNFNCAAPTNNIFSWGGANLVDPKETRQAYVAALRAADAHDLDALIAFARS